MLRLSRYLQPQRLHTPQTKQQVHQESKQQLQQLHFRVPAAPLQGARWFRGSSKGKQMVQSQSLLDLLRQNEDIARQTMFWSTALQESIARALRESQLRESQGEAAKTIARQDDSLLKLLHENEETALQMTHLSRGLWDSLKPHVRSNERRRRDTGSNVESL